MPFTPTGCRGQYDFEHIVEFARKRFIEGQDTVSLLKGARTEREKEEIILIALLDVEDSQVRDLTLNCRYANECAVCDCRQRLKQMFNEDRLQRSHKPATQP